MSQEGFEAAPKRRSVRKTPKPASLEEMIAAHPGKTPIQLLQEYGIKSGKPPMYDLEKAEGQPHLPSFTYKVILGDIIGSGQGPSKKIARHKAAEAALKTLKGDSNISLSVPDPAAAEPPKQQQSQPNPIGMLQEMAVKRGWRLPEYSLAEESGPPHKREFTMTCRIEKFSETGRGTSKKLAKRIAAEKLLEKIKSVPEDPIHISQVHSTENSIHCTLDSLKKSSGEKMSLLKRSPLNSPNCEYSKILLEVALEQKFDVNYLEIDELSVNGQYQCLAELSTSPVIICHGTGISCGNAYNSAAHNALQYLKILVIRH